MRFIGLTLISVIAFYPSFLIEGGAVEYDLMRFGDTASPHYIHFFSDVHNMGTSEQISQQVKGIYTVIQDYVTPGHRAALFIEEPMKAYRERFRAAKTCLLTSVRDVYEEQKENLDSMLERVEDCEVRHIPLAFTDFAHVYHDQWETRDGIEINPKQLTVGDLFDDYQQLKDQYFTAIADYSERKAFNSDRVFHVGHVLLQEIMERFDDFMEEFDHFFAQRRFGCIRHLPLLELEKVIVGNNSTIEEGWNPFTNRYLKTFFERVHAYSDLMIDFNFLLKIIEARNQHIFVVAGGLHVDHLKETLRKLDAQIIVCAEGHRQILEDVDNGFLYLKRILMLLLKHLKSIRCPASSQDLLDINALAKDLKKDPYPKPPSRRQGYKTIYQYAKHDDEIAAYIERIL